MSNKEKEECWTDSFKEQAPDAKQITPMQSTRRCRWSSPSSHQNANMSQSLTFDAGNEISAQIPSTDHPNAYIVDTASRNQPQGLGAEKSSLSRFVSPVVNVTSFMLKIEERERMRIV
jgi:hypothetical protein